MMNKFKKLKRIKLSDTEKKDLFSRISETIERDDPNTKLTYPILSPFFKRRHFKMAFLYSFLILFIGSATAFASLESLPGDFLYGVKTDVIEKIPSFLFTSPKERAKDNSQKVETRLKELEVLAEKGKLTGEHVKNIEKSIKKNLKDFDQEVEKVKKEKKEPKDATDKNELETELDSKLQKHSKKIKEIKEKVADEEKKALQSVLDRAHSWEENREKNRIIGNEEIF